MIPVRYKYKDYGRLAPRATARSRALGIFFSFVAQVMWGFLWAALWGFVLSESASMEDGLAYGIAFLSLIPFYWALNRWKQRLNDQIDRSARKEMEENLRKTQAGR